MTGTTIHTNFEDMIREKNKRRGGFHNVAAFSQGLMDLIRASPGWELMDPTQREGMTMIAHKQARLLAGDPSDEDSWRDIQGYSKLVTDHTVEQNAARARLRQQEGQFFQQDGGEPPVLIDAAEGRILSPQG